MRRPYRSSRTLIGRLDRRLCLVSGRCDRPDCWRVPYRPCTSSTDESRPRLLSCGLWSSTSGAHWILVDLRALQAPQLGSLARDRFRRPWGVGSDLGAIQVQQSMAGANGKDSSRRAPGSCYLALLACSRILVRSAQCLTGAPVTQLAQRLTIGSSDRGSRLR